VLSSKHDPASNALAVPGQPSINIAPPCFVAPVPRSTIPFPPFCAFALRRFTSSAAAGTSFHGNPVPTYSRLHPGLPLVCSAPNPRPCVLSRPDGPPQPAQCPMMAQEHVFSALLLYGRHATCFVAACCCLHLLDAVVVDVVAATDNMFLLRMPNTCFRHLSPSAPIPARFR
jgi:hypothetical protein